MRTLISSILYFAANSNQYCLFTLLLGEKDMIIVGDFNLSPEEEGEWKSLRIDKHAFVFLSLRGGADYRNPGQPAYPCCPGLPRSGYICYCFRVLRPSSEKRPFMLTENLLKSIEFAFN